MSVNAVDNIEVTDRPCGESHLPLRPNRTVHTLGGEKKHGMAPDSHIPFGRIFPDSAEVKIAITAIATCEQDRDKSRKWASRLKLLTGDVDRRKTSSSEDEDLTSAGIEQMVEEDDSNSTPGSCSCMNHRSARLAKNEKRLMLTDVDDLPDCMHYVAVSYSCASMRDAVYTGSPYTIRTKDGIRDPRCPPALLERVISYTWDKGLRYFWIDQECIDQADGNDLETGMQAMDMVYENSIDSVAVLRTVITEQRHCDALGSLVAFEPATVRSTHSTDVLEILELITADVWFQRAWTLQEATSGGTSMSLTLPCVSGIEVPPELRHRRFSNPNEHVEFGLNHLFVSVATWFEPGFPGFCEDSDSSIALRLQSWRDRWERMFPTGTYDFDADGLMSLCPASEALWHMSVRENSVVADRLAIIANLCGYEKRLDTMKLDELGYGFSICVLVLAMLNGDTSILASVGAYNRGKRGKLNRMYTDIRGRTPGHGTSWILPPELCLNDVPTKEGDSHGTSIELTKADLLPDGLLTVEGCMWAVDSNISLESVRSHLLQTYTPLELEEASSAGPWYELEDAHRHLQTKLLTGFSMSLLSYLSTCGLSNLVRLLWRELRPRRSILDTSLPEEAHGYVGASFEQVVDVASGSIIWQAPSCIRGLLPESTEPFAVMGSPLRQYLLQMVVQRQSVPIARPTKRASRMQEYAAIFEDAAPGDRFFTPRLYVEPALNFEPEATLSVPLIGFSWYPLCWRVAEESAGNDTDGRSLLRCYGLHCGAWLADEQDQCEAELV